jgi:predicted RNA polymerase sigma factor
MELIPRLDAVLHAIYLLFNEGYNSSHAARLIRDELCEDAMRLCVLLTRNSLTDRPEANALLALMCFQASRSQARLDTDGNIILLQQQDRSRWYQPLIERGKFYLEKASEDEQFTEYHLEAAIAGIHASAPSFDETDWRSIYELYDALCLLRPGSITELNRAIALGFSSSPKDGLEALKRIRGLEDNSIYHSAIGDFLKSLGQKQNARESYEQAMKLTQSKANVQLLKEKISLCN